MRLEAKNRLESANPKDFAKVLNSMTSAQILKLTQGIWGIANWFSGDYVGKPGAGKLVVSKDAPDLTLCINAMKWLQVYFGKPPGISAVYRLHDFRRPVKPGETVTLKPFKPILSWTTLPKPHVEGRNYTANDYVIKLSKPPVVFSYKMLDTLYECSASLRKENLKSHNKYLKLDDALVSLRNSMRKYASEKEAVVYHGAEPVEVTVLREA